CSLSGTCVNACNPRSAFRDVTRDSGQKLCRMSDPAAVSNVLLRGQAALLCKRSGSWNVRRGEVIRPHNSETRHTSVVCVPILYCLCHQCCWLPNVGLLEQVQQMLSI